MVSRYQRSPKINGGKSYGTYNAGFLIYEAIQRRAIDYVTHVSKESERLDIIAGRYYKDSSLWWVIAAASGIGWGLQVPPGTLLNIPIDVNQVTALVG